METQPQLLLLQKTMVVAEGVGRALNPNVNMWQLAQPLIEAWIADNLGPQAQLRSAVEDGLEAARRLPHLVDARRAHAGGRGRGRRQAASDLARRPCSGGAAKAPVAGVDAVPDPRGSGAGPADPVSGTPPTASRRIGHAIGFRRFGVYFRGKGAWRELRPLRAHGTPRAARVADRAGCCDAANPRILLIIAGGIAAYKSLELIRRLRERGIGVRCILTAAGAEFVTPLAVASLSGERVFTDLFSLTDEAEMGHIRLSREADLVVVAPATADLIAKMAHGLADDLASTALLATDKPVLIAPAMNPMMWDHPATRRNVAPAAGGRRPPGRAEPGDMACGETGIGRMAEPEQILAAIEELLAPADRGARRQARAGDQRPDDRGDRPGAVHRQSLLRQAGPRDRGGAGRRAGADGHAGQRPGARGRIRRG